MSVDCSPRIGIVILHWNGISETDECLNSLLRLNYSNFFTVLVDNGSPDLKETGHTFEQVDEEKVLTLGLKENLGFAGGCNRGIEKALANGAEYTLLLNNDTVVTENFLCELVKGTLTPEKYRILGGKIYHYNSGDTVWYRGGRINWLTGGGTHPGKGKREKQQSSRAIFPVNFVTGCMMLVHKSVFQKIGLFNTSYFLYSEDTDFCARAKRSGISIGVNLSSVIYHRERSTKDGWKPDHIYYLVRNRIIFMKKQRPSIYIMPVFYFSLFFLGAIPALFWCVGGRGDLLKAICEGVYDGIKNVIGPRKKCCKPVEL